MPLNLSKYPAKPGCYLMKDKTGRVLYVGKALNLKARIRQYFIKGSDTREMIPYLIQNVDKVDVILVPSERDALLLENNLIKKHKPKYNILLKDDKTYVSLVLTKHKWPQLKITRQKKKVKDEGNFFGPYTNAKIARDILDLMNRIFPLRECSDQELASRTRPCLLHGIKRCVAPCVDLCSQEEYENHVKTVRNLLLGKDKTILKELESKMKIAAENQQFEKAANLRDMKKKIEFVTSKQHVDNQAAKSCDVLGLYREADSVMIVKLLFRDYKLLGSEHYSFHQILSVNEEVISTFIMQHYEKNEHLPQEIFSPISLTQIEALETFSNIKISSPQKGDKKKLIDMAHLNAEANFKRELDERALNEKMLFDLAHTLKLNHFPKVITCFDTSNIAGSDPVAAMVTFVDGKREKNLKRLFKIRGASDDYAATKEVLTRAFTKAKENQDLPDLVIVDGGKGQLNLCLEVFENLEIANVDLIALTKENALHTKGLTKEKVYLPHEKEPLLINPHSPLLFLLQKIRDEAHRAAIAFHRKKRSKSTIKTTLDSVEGIGPTKKKRLLKTFGSVKRIKEASDEAILEVQGITKKDLENLRTSL